MTGGCVWGGCGAPVWAGWPSGSPGCRTAQRGALCRHDWPTVAQKQKSPPPASTGGGPGRKGCLMLLVDPVSPFALVGFEGLDLVASFLQRAGDHTTNGVPFPLEGAGQFVQRSAIFPAQHRDHLGGLAALARPGGALHLGGFLRLGRFLGRGGLLPRLGLHRRALGGLCATFGLLSRLRLGGRRLGLRGVAQALDAVPDAAGGRLAALEALYGRYASQAVPNRDQSLRRPRLGQFRQFLLAAEAVEGGCGCGGGLVLVRKRHNFVRFVDGECLHCESPWCRALRGHHMNPSEALESKGLSEINLRWRRFSDGRRRRGCRSD